MAKPDFVERNGKVVERAALDQHSEKSLRSEMRKEFPSFVVKRGSADLSQTAFTPDGTIVRPRSNDIMDAYQETYFGGPPTVEEANFDGYGKFELDDEATQREIMEGIGL